MARVELGRLREQSRHYGLYKQASPTGDLIVVRRKVGEPVDYQHNSSRAVKRQRQVFAQASQHYSHLTRRQRQELKYQAEEVEYVRGHGKTDLKLLQGRPLFLSKDIHSLLTTGDYLPIPGEICVVLADQNYNPIPGYWLRLYYSIDGAPYLTPVEISPSNYLFSYVPPKKAPYHFLAAAMHYYDFSRWEPTSLTWHQLQRQHYHRLTLGYLYTSRVFGVWATTQGWLPQFSFPINTAHCHSEIWAGDYEGKFRVGIRDYSGDRPPGTYIFEEAIHLHPSYPQPQIIDFTKYNLNLKPGEYNYMRSHRLIPFADKMLHAEVFITLQP